MAKKKKKVSKKKKPVRKAKKKKVSKKKKPVRKAKKKKVSKKKKPIRKAKKKKVSKKKKPIRKAKKKKVSKKKKTNLKKQSTKSNNKIFKVPSEWSKKAYIDKKGYEKKYTQSINDNDTFWAEEGKRIDWIKPYTKIKDVTYSKDNVDIKWFYDGTLNVSYNCIDRHLPTKSK